MKRIFILVFFVFLNTIVFAQKTKSNTSNNANDKIEFTPKKVLEKYWDALGGKGKLDSIKSTIVESEYNIDGVHFSEITKILGQKVNSTQKKDGVITVQKFNGEQGVMEQNGNNIPLTKEQIEKLKKIKLVPALDYNLKNYKIAIKESFEGKEYAVLVSGKKKEYFDINSGLLTLVKDPNSETHITDYISVKGMMFPSIISVKEKNKNTKIKVMSIIINSGVSESDFKF